MKRVSLLVCLVAIVAAACNDNQILDLTGDTSPTPVDPQVPADYQPRIYFLWDASDAMLQPVPALDLDSDGVAGSTYDAEDNVRWTFSCADSNDVVHPHYGTPWASWDEVSNTRYDLMAAGLLQFLDDGAIDPAANGNLEEGTPLDPSAPPSCADLGANGKDDNHDSDQIDLAMLALGSSWGADHIPGNLDDDACRFKEETTSLRRGGGPVRGFFRERNGNEGFPADTNTTDDITHNDWVADHVIYTDLGGSAQTGRALQALAAPADGTLDADGIASIPDVMARDANSGCRPYAVVLVSASGWTPGCSAEGDAAAAAETLTAQGVPTYVISPSDHAMSAGSYLAEIADHGGTSAPHFVSTTAEMLTSLREIRHELLTIASGCP